MEGGAPVSEGYIFDYRLGYVRGGCPLPGFDVIGDVAAPRVVALGGYTTPAMAQGGQSWAHALYARRQGAHILNGCADGYSSAQILTLFIRDVILFAPKRVVCLSGFYNVAYRLGLVPNKNDAGLLSTHPFATPMQLGFLRAITARFGLDNDAVFYGLENHMPAAELWLRQMAEIKCLCDEFEIEFRSYLQPCVFSGAYARTRRENAFLCEHYGLTQAEIEGFHAGFAREYAQMADGAKGLGYITDLSGVFDGYRDVYVDACHVREAFLPRLVEEMQ